MLEVLRGYPNAISLCRQEPTFITTHTCLHLLPLSADRNATELHGRMNIKSVRLIQLMFLYVLLSHTHSFLLFFLASIFSPSVSECAFAVDCRIGNVIAKNWTGITTGIYLLDTKCENNFH